MKYISRCYLLLVMVLVVSCASVLAQTPAPPLTASQITRLLQVKAWDIQFTRTHTVLESGSGATLTCISCPSPISGWTVNHTYDLTYSIAYTIRGQHCGSNYGGIVYTPPGTFTLTNYQDIRQEDITYDGCPHISPTGPGTETYVNSYTASGTSILDSSSYEKEIRSSLFCIDTTVNPPVVRSYALAGDGINGIRIISTIGCGDSMYSMNPAYPTGTFDMPIYPTMDSSKGYEGLGDTQVREEGGRFVIHGNSSKIVDRLICVHNVAVICDTASYYPGHYEDTWSWVIHEHPDSSYRVARPQAGELWVTSEKDTIVWHSSDSGAVNISYSIDSGMTYRSIVNDFAGADSQHYIWKVPNGIRSRKAVVKVESAADTTRSGESDLFKMKACELTRVTANGDYEAFTPGTHGWSFPNADSSLWTTTEFVFYAVALDSVTGQDYPRWFVHGPSSANFDDFPTWPLVVRTFGKNACYFDSTGLGLTYRPSAVEFWRGIRGRHHGSCQGMAIASAGAFDDKSSLLASFPQIGNFTNLYELPSTVARRAVINQIMTAQYGVDQIQYENQNDGTPVSQAWIDSLKEIFRADERSDGIDMCMLNQDHPPGGHVVTPYRVEQDSDAYATTRIYVYDNNYPADTGRFIRLLKIGGVFSWHYGNLGGNNHLYHEPVSLYLNGAVLPTSAGRRSPSGPLAAASQSMRFYVPPGASVRLANAGGDSVGYADSASFGSIPGAKPIIPRTGYVQPPIGYAVPSDDYTIQMRDFIDSTAYCSVFGDSMIYTYSRSGAGSGQGDLLRCSNGLTIQNSDPSAKQIYTGGVIVQSDNEKVFEVSDVSIGQNDSIRVSSPDRHDVHFVNYGGPKTYTLQLRSASSNGDVAFEHANIPLPGNTMHIVEPAWDSLQGQRVKILVDQGNDGSIDDSMLVDNQTTGVGGRPLAGVPTEFNLHQNYPNPFNPNTTIRYDLPVSSFVTLTVYNVLGQPVATLVNDTRGPGSWSVEWDATRFASGVYYCRLEAGRFVETRKLLLVK